jgi:hypothetical protein
MRLPRFVVDDVEAFLRVRHPGARVRSDRCSTYPLAPFPVFETIRSMGDPRPCVRIAASILALSLFGCGASNSGSINPAPPPGCGLVSSCGGDVTGTWKVLGGCSDALVGLPCPPNTPEELVGEGFAGTLTFNSDMTYSASIVGTGTSTFTLPSTCLPAGVSCSQLISPSCTGSGSCTCQAIPAFASLIGGSGTYDLKGNDISFSPSQGSAQGTAYCVQGEFLHLESSETVIGNGTTTMPITSDIVAQKQ